MLANEFFSHFYSVFLWDWSDEKQTSKKLSWDLNPCIKVTVKSYRKFVYPLHWIINVKEVFSQICTDVLPLRIMVVIHRVRITVVRLLSLQFSPLSWQLMTDQRGSNWMLKSLKPSLQMIMMFAAFTEFLQKNYSDTRDAVQ